MSTWSHASAVTACRTTGCGTGCGSGSSTSPACGGCYGARSACRRFRRCSMLADLSHGVGDYLYNVFFMKLTWLVLVGYSGQPLFTIRFLVHGIASGRAKKSVFPVAFSLFSISGGRVLFV